MFFIAFNEKEYSSGVVAGVDRDGSRFAPSEGIKENEDDFGRAVHLI